MKPTIQKAPLDEWDVIVDGITVGVFSTEADARTYATLIEQRQEDQS